jgi:hypothetical protein
MESPRGSERRPSADSGDARDAMDLLFALDELLGLHLRALAMPVVPPLWCQESLARDSARTGRSLAAIARWALLWPLATVVVLVLLTVIIASVGWNGPIALLCIIVVLGGVMGTATGPASRPTRGA